MQHNAEIEGFNVRLRPVGMQDAAFIVWLRNLEHVRGRVGDSATTSESQEAWLRDYFKRPGDYYFIVETSSRIPVGAYGIYAVRGKSAESGRWAIRPGVPAAIPSAVLAFDLAFGKLHLTELRVSTVSTNQPVLSLNRKFGFREVRTEKAAQNIGGQSVDLIHFLLEGKDWPAVRQKLVPFAELASKQIAEWQTAQGTAGSQDFSTASSSPK